MAYSWFHEGNIIMTEQLFNIEDFFDKSYMINMIDTYKDIFNINIFFLDDKYNIYISSKKPNLIFKDITLKNKYKFKNYIKNYNDNNMVTEEGCDILDIQGFAAGIAPVLVNNCIIGTFILVDNSKGFLTKEKVKSLCKSNNLEPSKYIDEFYSLKDYDGKKFTSILMLFKQYFKINKGFKRLPQLLEVQILISNIIDLNSKNTSLKEIMFTICNSCVDIFNVDNVSMVLVNPESKERFAFSDNTGNDKYNLENLLNFNDKQKYLNIKDVSYKIESYFNKSSLYFNTYSITILDDVIGYIYLIKETEAIKIHDIENIMFNSIIKISSLCYKLKVTKRKYDDITKLFHKTFDNLNIGVYVNDFINRNLTYTNNCFLKQHNLEKYKNNNNQDYNESLMTYMNLINKDGEFYRDDIDKWFYNYSVNTNWIDGTEVVFGLVFDITENKKKDMLIEKLKWSDKLTSLPNRSKLILDLDDIIKGGTKGYNFTILNIDFFNRINFSYGYNYGNKFILEIAKFLKALNTQYAVYHLGGSEFGLIIKGEEKLKSCIKTIQGRFNEPWIVESLEQYCTASIGITQLPEVGSVSEIIIQNTFSALKRAKNTGRNRVCYFEPNIDDKGIKNTQLEYYLRSAVMKNIDYFKVYYQPVVDAQSGKIVSFEALVRWIDPEIGFVPPDEFITLAEDLGFISIIGNHVLETASKFIKTIHNKGYLIDLSVNLSTNQLYEENLVDTIKETILKTGLDYKYIQLEVTETSAITDFSQTIKKLEQLKELGIRLSLDDFGKGYSSLNILKDIPVNTVKIDKQFIKDMNKSLYNYTFVRTIIELAHSANLRVCCEGVETFKEWNDLKLLNSDVLQGYYFAKPLPEDKVLEVLLSNY